MPGSTSPDTAQVVCANVVFDEHGRCCSFDLLGLSTAMLLDQTTSEEAIQVLDRHLDNLVA